MLVNRRDFLKVGAAGGSSLLVSGGLRKYAQAAEDGLEGRLDRFALLTDTTRCVGCRRCEAACNKANSLRPQNRSFEDPSVFQEKRRTDIQVYTVVNRFENPKWPKPVYLKIQCNHCAEPACASACLVGALQKNPEGPVLYDESKCIGCRYCITACPFYVPTFDYYDAAAPKIEKCNMCYHRIAKGMIPACAAACAVEAIKFGKRNELIKLARDRIRENPGKYIDHIYGEHEVGGTDWLYISGVRFEELGLPANVGTAPYAQYTREFLAAVPFVLVVWPALLGGFYNWTKRPDKIGEAQVTNKK